MIEPRTINRLFALSFFASLLAPFLLGAHVWLNAPTKHADLNAVSYPLVKEKDKPVAVVVPALR